MMVLTKSIKNYMVMSTMRMCEKAKAITPVPGGVGPMTIHALLLNTYHLYENHVK